MKGAHYHKWVLLAEKKNERLKESKYGGKIPSHHAWSLKRVIQVQVLFVMPILGDVIQLVDGHTVNVKGAGSNPVIPAKYGDQYEMISVVPFNGANCTETSFEVPV